MPYFQFMWREETIKHIARNDVSQDDFEHVVCHSIDRDISRTSGLPVAFGYTMDGRYVMAVYRHLDEMTIQPVTAYLVPEPRR